VTTVLLVIFCFGKIGSSYCIPEVSKTYKTQALCEAGAWKVIDAKRKTFKTGPTGVMWFCSEMGDSV
jgi:hypothetical protein